MLDNLLKKITELQKCLTSPCQIGFVQGHRYLNSDQILQMQQVLESGKNEAVVSEYEKRITSLIGLGFGISFVAGWLFTPNSPFFS